MKGGRLIHPSQLIHARLNLSAGALGSPAASVVLGIALFVGASLVPSTGFFDSQQTGNAPLYRTYGDALLAGQLAYRDFFVEYPPGALPAFAIPSLGPDADYVTAFKLLMVGCGALLVGFVALGLRAVEDAPRLPWVMVFAGLVPVALGPVLLTRYDLWPAVLTALALAALLSGRRTLGFIVLGVAVTAKIYPLVLLPLAFLYARRRWGERMAWRGLAAFVIATAVVLVPFGALAPGGVRYSLSFQADRPLQIESLGAGILLAARHLGADTANVVSSFNSENLDGSVADALATAAPFLQVLAVAAACVLFARSPRDGGSLATASAAAVAGVVTFGKVLSPQFVVWLVPLVLLVPRRAGTVAAGLLGTALVLTQLLRLWDGVGLSAAGWVVLGRNAMLLGLFAVLVEAIRRRGRPSLRGSA